MEQEQIVVVVVSPMELELELELDSRFVMLPFLVQPNRLKVDLPCRTCGMYQQ